MKPERYNLLHFFNEIVNLGIRNPGRPGWGNPTSYAALEAIRPKNTLHLSRLLENSSRKEDVPNGETKVKNNVLR
jgi:hypothetical protein